MRAKKKNTNLMSARDPIGFRCLGTEAENSGRRERTPTLARGPRTALSTRNPTSTSFAARKPSRIYHRLDGCKVATPPDVSDLSGLLPSHHVKISSRSSYRCGQRHRGVGFRGKSRPGIPLAEAQGRGFSWQSETIPCVKS